MTLSTTEHHPEVLLSPEAEQDLRDIYAYMAAQAGQERDDILDKLKTAILLLETLPLRDNIPLELEVVGITRYRELSEYLWRII